MNTRIVKTGIFVILLTLLCACGASVTPGSQFIGTRAPQARFTLMDGSSVSLDAFQGKTVVVAFWRYDCPKSKQMLNTLRDFAVRYEKRPAVEFIAVSVDKPEKRSEVEQRIALLHSSKIIFAYSGNEVLDEAYRLFQGYEVPYVLVINPKGEVIASGDSARVFEKNVY